MPAQIRMAFRWDDVSVFLAACRSGSLHAASIRLGVDDSTVSRRLTALEEALGLRLFDRSRHGLVPTASAERLLPSAEEAESAMSRLGVDAGSLDRELEGLVRITAPPGVSETLLVPLVAKLRVTHPGIRLELDASQRIADLTRRESDIALRPIRPTSPDLVQRRVISSQFAPLVSRKWASSMKRITAWQAVPWIGWSDEWSHLPEAKWLAGIAAADVVLKSGSLAAQLAAAELGVGAVIVPRVVTTVTSLVVMPVAGDPMRELASMPAVELWMVGHRALREVPRIRVTWDLLVAEIDRLVRPPRPREDESTRPRRSSKKAVGSRPRSSTRAP